MLSASPALVRARAWIGTAGIVLLGGALAVAPILAILGDMRMVTAAGVAGIALLIVARFLPRAAEPEGPAAEGGDSLPADRSHSKL